MNNKRISEYCSACGLCQGKGYAELKFNDGLLKPNMNVDNTDFFESVCPITGSGYEIQPEWGEFEKVYVGYSNDPDIRHMASSGGVITSLASYLLDKKLIDVIEAGIVRFTNPQDCNEFDAIDVTLSGIVKLLKDVQPENNPPEILVKASPNVTSVSAVQSANT